MNFALPLSRPNPGLLAADDPLPALASFAAEGTRFALVTLVSIEGGSPRPPGAQMVVAEDGRYHGYLSGGCLEQAIVLEAQAAIAAGKNRLVRYGKGSPYFDVRLPCGSGLDVYFDAGLSGHLVSEMERHRRFRKPFALVTNLDGGASSIDECRPGDMSRREADRFTRVYLPLPRMVLLGSGPAVPALAQLAMAAGLETETWAGDDATRTALDALGAAHHASAAPADDLFALIDSYSAVVLAFHEHDSEPGILARVLKAPNFYIGVLGNHGVHRRRLEALASLGFSGEDLQRIRAPVGAIPQAKGTATLAIGVLAEIFAEAKLMGLVV